MHTRSSTPQNSFTMPASMQSHPSRRQSALLTSPMAIPRRCHVPAALALALLLPALMVPRALAQTVGNPPGKLSYQGFLTDVNGRPIGLDSPVNKPVTFRIFDANTAGTRLWASQQTVTVDKGHFSVLLGEGSAVAGETFNADLTDTFTTGSGVASRFLEVAVDGVAIAPRQQFLSTPFALLAKKAVEVAGTVPVGGIIMWSGTNVPSGWALCDGKDGRPNLQDRFILGAGNRTVGTTGGEEKHLQTVAEMPAHKHRTTAVTARATGGNHTHTYNDPLIGAYKGLSYDDSGTAVEYVTTNGGTTTGTGAHTHEVNVPAVDTESTGGDGAIPIMPPYYVLAFIIRVQ